MKKCISMLLVLVMAWGITACQSVQVEESDDTQVENTQVHDAPMEMTEYQPIKEAKQTEAIDDNMELQTESKADRKSYYGSFEVVSYSAPGVSALPPEERVEYPGKICVYGEDSFISDGNVTENPIYVETQENKTDYTSDNEAMENMLQNMGDTMTQVSVENSFAFGSIFLVQDEDTLFIAKDGVYFMAVREK